MSPTVALCLPQKSGRHANRLPWASPTEGTGSGFDPTSRCSSASLPLRPCPWRSEGPRGRPPSAGSAHRGPPRPRLSPQQPSRNPHRGPGLSGAPDCDAGTALRVSARSRAKCRGLQLSRHLEGRLRGESAPASSLVCHQPYPIDTRSAGQSGGIGVRDVVRSAPWPRSPSRPMSCESRPVATPRRSPPPCSREPRSWPPPLARGRCGSRGPAE